ncbi:hypothetical protein TNCV_5109921 [Trichonephila clavipes]|nr:hypothetical protein TNCV_5109921 [Trichonephila clavipes]
MYNPSCFANPTPLAHADTSRDVLPRGGYLLFMRSDECAVNFRIRGGIGVIDNVHALILRACLSASGHVGGSGQNEMRIRM